MPTQQVGSGQLRGRSELAQGLPRERVSTCRKHSKETQPASTVEPPVLGGEPSKPARKQHDFRFCGNPRGALGVWGALACNSEDEKELLDEDQGAGRALG